MDPILNDFHHTAATLTYHTPEIPIISNLTGAIATPEQLTTPTYWTNHLRHTVRFTDTLHTLHHNHVTTYLEITPTPTLSPLITDTLPDSPTPIAIAHPRRPEQHTLIAALAQAHIQGVPIDWTAYFRDHNPRQTRLPTYPFQRRRYWIDPPEQAAAHGGQDDAEDLWRAVENGDVEALAAALGAGAAEREPLAAVLPMLSSWRVRKRSCYRISWEPVPEPTGPAAAERSWLVAVPQGTASMELADALAAAGDRVVLLAVPTTPTTGQGDERPLRDILAAQPPVDAVLSLLAYAEDRDGVDALDRATAAVTATHALLAAVHETLLDTPVWLATGSAWAVEPDDPADDPAQAAVWGLGQALATEAPDRLVRLIDLPRKPDERAVRRIRTLLAHLETTENQLALRPSGLFARRLVPARPDERAANGWRPHGTVLIHGADTPLGERISRWVEEHGATVTVVRDGPDIVEDLLAAVRSAEDPPTAVLHIVPPPAAGPVGPARLRDALRGLHPAVILDRLVRELEPPLETVATVTSIAGVLGTAGFGNQAPADAFLTALAARRDADGLPAQVLEVVPWEADDPRERDGVRPLPQEAVLSLLGAAQPGTGPLLLADIDWARLAARLGPALVPPLLRSIPAVRQALGTVAAPTHSVLETLRKLPDDERIAYLTTLVQTQVAVALGYAEPDQIDPDGDLNGLGLSSFTSLELVTRLRGAGLRLAPAEVFEHPSAAALARHLHAGLQSAPT
jgi:acyl transferase domain-containing protein/aryl carrier-like protein